MTAIKKSSIQKFKEMGKPDWRTSKYAFVINAFEAHVYQSEKPTKKALEVNDQIMIKYVNKKKFLCHSN